MHSGSTVTQCIKSSSLLFVGFSNLPLLSTVTMSLPVLPPLLLWNSTFQASPETELRVHHFFLTANPSCLIRKQWFPSTTPSLTSDASPRGPGFHWACPPLAPTPPQGSPYFCFHSFQWSSLKSPFPWVNHSLKKTPKLTSALILSHVCLLSMFYTLHGNWPVTSVLCVGTGITFPPVFLKFRFFFNTTHWNSVHPGITLNVPCMLSPLTGLYCFIGLTGKNLCNMLHDFQPKLDHNLCLLQWLPS